MTSNRMAQAGVTYLWMLFLVFLISLGLGKSLEVYSTQVQRQKEADLLYVGGLYREAIRVYYESSPGSLRKYPERLEDLLRDPRHLTLRRYIRQLYPDPISGEPFEIVLSPEGGIMGVHSPSSEISLRQLGVFGEEQGAGSLLRYSDWRFVHVE